MGVPNFPTQQMISEDIIDAHDIFDYIYRNNYTYRAKHGKTPLKNLHITSHREDGGKGRVTHYDISMESHGHTLARTVPPVVYGPEGRHAAVSLVTYFLDN